MRSPNALPPAAFDTQNRFMPTATSYKLFRTSVHVRPSLRVPPEIVTYSHCVSHSVLAGEFIEGKPKDLRSPFPPDQPLELDDHDFLDDSDLEEVEGDVKLTIKIPETAPKNLRSPLKSPGFGSGFPSPFSPQISRFGSMGGMSSICAMRSTDPGTHLGKVVVLRDISFVT
jgi:hypothetical protein